MTNNELTPEAGLPAGIKGSWTWGIVAATGLALAITGLGNLATGWLPPRLHNDEWRFMVSGSTLDGFSVVTLGAVGLFAGLYGLRRNNLLRLYACLSAALALGLCGIYAAFLTTLPRIHKLAESATEADTVRAGVTRTSVAAAAMFLLLAGVTWAAWRQGRSEPVEK